MPQNTYSGIYIYLLKSNKPNASAWIKGNTKHRELKGIVKFYAVPAGGVLVEAEIRGLPADAKGGTSSSYAFHIHEKEDCLNNFADADNHYNLTGEPHPNHEGDMIPLMSDNGYAWMTFYDRRFNISEITGRSVIIHQKADDYVTQSSESDGDKIGCGVILADVI